MATVTQSLVRENHELRQTTEDLKKENQKQEREFEILREEMKLMVGGFPINFHVKYERETENIFLPSFYTHSYGYQIRIKFYPNGYGDSKGSHVSIYTHIMQGPYDDHLKWPFRGRITVQIVNQAGDHSHVENTITYDDKTPDTSAGRVTDKESGGGRGFPKFLAHTDLEYNATKKTQYLKDDIIIVRVVKVIITQ